MEKILVTGGLGYIGSHVVVELQKMNFEVIIVDDLSNSSLDVLGGIEKITGIKTDFEKIDLKRKSDVREFFNRHSDLGGVIHFAAAKAVSESVNNPLKYYENNICSLVYLLEELKKKSFDEVGNLLFLFSPYSVKITSSYTLLPPSVHSLSHPPQLWVVTRDNRLSKTQKGLFFSR